MLTNEAPAHCRCRSGQQGCGEGGSRNVSGVLLIQKRSTRDYVQGGDEEKLAVARVAPKKKAIHHVCFIDG